MKEEELLKKRLMELCEKAYNQNIYTYTHFLNEYEQSIYQDMKQELAYAHPILVGGHKHFTRAVVMFGSEELFGYQGEVPVVCARISPVFDKFAEELSHRDYLGALMNLGIERHLIGDILIDGRYAYIFCMEHIIGVIKEQLDQVRHTRVFVEEVLWEETGYVQKYKKKEGFVASMRLDVLVSQAFSLSRNISEKLLKSQKVFHNGKMCLSGMITPVEVLGKELRRGFGYKAVEVDEFLEELAKDYEKVYKENNELREKVSALTENLSHYRTIEESLKRALVLAEETSKETIENANNKAQALEAEASRNAKQLVSEAEDQAEKILTSAKEDFKEEKEQHEKTIENYQKLIRKLESDYQSYKARMKQFINGQMDILDNPVYEMEFEIAGCEQTDGDEEDEQQKQFGNEQ